MDLSRGLVVDANVGNAWIFPSHAEERAYAAAVLDLIADTGAMIVVPSLFHVEVGNFMLKRRRTPAANFSKARMDAALERLSALRWDTRLTPFDTSGLVRFGDMHRIQGKDVPYFALALAHKLPMATLDGGVRKACERSGVEVVRFN